MTERQQEGAGSVRSSAGRWSGASRTFHRRAEEPRGGRLARLELTRLAPQVALTERRLRSIAAGPA